VIKKLLIFENSGICLFSKQYGLSTPKEDDELITGFLAALFGYVDSQFGRLDQIKTEDSILLVSKIQGMFITLVTSQIKSENPLDKDEEKNRFLNHRLETTCKTQLGLIERKVSTLLLKLQLRQEKTINYKTLFMDIERELDKIIEQGQSKINIIKKLFKNHTISNALEIYKI